MDSTEYCVKCTPNLTYSGTEMVGRFKTKIVDTYGGAPALVAVK
jgi:hypothetical protein